MGCSFLLISPEPINVAVDEKRIRQVLMNIIINAVNHSPKNSQIIVSLTKHNKKALCQIADCGSGIPENKLANRVGPKTPNTPCGIAFTTLPEK